MKRLYVTRFFLSLVLLTYLQKQTRAQNFHLVKDINASTDGNPYNDHVGQFSGAGATFAVLNGVSYFGAGGVNAKALWRSDGTEAGTYLLKDSINPNNITVVNGKLFFTGSGSSGLWTSDGTTNGTTEISMPTAQTGGQYPFALTNFNGALYFVMGGTFSSSQLWKSDGTSDGTVMVKDFYNSDPQKAINNLTNPTVIKNKLYLFGLGQSAGYSSFLCVSDGTTSGSYSITNSVIDPTQLVAGSSSSTDSLVYFTASTVHYGKRSLYVTNGDPGNIAMVSGFNGGVTGDYYSTTIVAKNGFIYFTGYEDGVPNVQGLYRYDISHSANRIEPVKTVAAVDPNGSYNSIENLRDVAGTLYFSLYSGSSGKRQLWKSDGNINGNVLLNDNLTATNFIALNGLAFFSGTDSSHSAELWRSNGTSIGTFLVKDINPGKNASSPGYLTGLNGKILFAASDGFHGKELWMSEGTNDGTLLIKDLNKTLTGSSSPAGLAKLNDQLMFVAWSGREDTRPLLWRTDGTNNGTLLINDSIYINNLNYKDTLATFNSYAYFFGTLPSEKRGLYKANGTLASTVLVKEFSAEMIPYKIVATDNVLYLVLYNASTFKYELWRTDGTDANTYVVKQDFNYSTQFYPAGNTLFFISQSAELWKTDGTPGGTILLKLFQASLYNAAVHNGLLFFGASEANYVNVLWRSDGTPAGTIKVTDRITDPSSLISSPAGLFFRGTDNSGFFGSVGAALFKTSGTESGTRLVKAIYPGPNSPNIITPVVVDGILYFFVNVAEQSTIELWRSDGTPAGTRSIASLGRVLTPSKLLNCNGRLFFIVQNTLWESDLSEAGTHTVTDHIVDQVTLAPFDDNNLTAVGSQLFFTATSTTSGKELYAGTIIKDAPTNYISAADGNWSDPATWADHKIPPDGASVIIRHNVIGNINTTCNGLWVEAAGTLTLNTGVDVRVLQ